MRLTNHMGSNTLEKQIQRIYLKIRSIKRKYNRKRLKNRDFSLISSNCNGALILHDLGLRFNSPFVNLWIRPKDYIKMLKDLKGYMESDLVFVSEEGISYPIGLLKDIKVYFQHYSSREEALKKWNERKNRINYDNLFVIFTDRDGCTIEDIKEFDNIESIKNKVVFTHSRTNDIDSAVYIKGFENEDEVGNLYEYMTPRKIKKYYDQFDYVRWFNRQ